MTSRSNSHPRLVSDLFKLVNLLKKVLAKLAQYDGVQFLSEVSLVLLSLHGRRIMSSLNILKSVCSYFYQFSHKQYCIHSIYYECLQVQVTKKTYEILTMFMFDQSAASWCFGN